MKKVSIRLVKEEELDYGVDRITRSEEVAKVLWKYIGNSDREMFNCSLFRYKEPLKFY